MLTDPNVGENFNGRVNIPSTTEYTGVTIATGTASITASTSLGAVGDHAHAISGSTNSTGSSTAINILPPYYALCYIQKMF
jgi:hypothetical protein